MIRAKREIARKMMPITIIRHSDGKFRVWAPGGPYEPNGIPFGTFDEAKTCAEQFASKRGAKAEIKFVDLSGAVVTEPSEEEIAKALELAKAWAKEWEEVRRE
jgi:hypothetical protein